MTNGLRVPEPYEYVGFLPDDFTGEVLGMIDIAWSGWEGDHTALLYRRDGVKGIEILSATLSQRPQDILADRIVEYERLIRDTRAFLEEFRRDD